MRRTYHGIRLTVFDFATKRKAVEPNPKKSHIFVLITENDLLKILPTLSLESYSSKDLEDYHSSQLKGELSIRQEWAGILIGPSQKPDTPAVPTFFCSGTKFDGF